MLSCRCYSPFVDGRDSRLAAGRTPLAGAGAPAASGSRSWCHRRGGRARRWRPPRGWWPGRCRAAPRIALTVPRSAGPGPGHAKSPPKQTIEQRFDAESGILPTPDRTGRWARRSTHNLRPVLTIPPRSCWLRRCCPLEPALHPQGRPCGRPPAALGPRRHGWSGPDGACSASLSCVISPHRPVNLEHDHGGLKDHPPSVLPDECIAFLLGPVLLALHEVADRAPVRQQSVEERCCGRPQLWPVLIQDGPDPCHIVRLVSVHARWSVAIDQHGRESLHRFPAQMASRRQLLLGVALP
jgi:hypothetical protein